MEITEVIDLIYAAAFGEGASWQDVGDQLMQLLEAQRATLWLSDERGVSGNLLMRTDAYDEHYASHYVALDPYRAAAREVNLELAAQRRGDVRLGHEIVPDARYVNSAFYADFGSKSSRRYMIGGLIGTSKVIPLGLHRDASSRPFEEANRRTLSLLLPHLQRALQMRERLAPVADPGSVVLDILPIAVFLVDPQMRVLYCNAEAVTLLSNNGSGLSTARHSPGPVATASRLFARHLDDDARLCRLVAAASRGGVGGGMQIRAPGASALTGDAATLSTLVCPAPRHLSSLARLNPGAGVIHGVAAVVARHLHRPLSPRVQLLVDIFGLTRAEAHVAVALAGGSTAEVVASTRGVSLETVRSQIRAILRKTGTSGLREFERVIALTATMQAEVEGQSVVGRAGAHGRATI
ncbi:HTH luxR-type domain-containing protein [Pararobbsia alpina]|uniref:helix-turn-helix transcriptional regulator n=1 Tax=Pararobbsia alpina TaxID=621374 RepID=UPI0039A43548